MIQTTGVSALLQVALPNAARPAVVAVGILYFRGSPRDQRLGGAQNAHRGRLLRRWKGNRPRALTVASVSGPFPALRSSVSGLHLCSRPGAMYIVLSSRRHKRHGRLGSGEAHAAPWRGRALITIPDAIGARYRSRGAQGLSATRFSSA